MGRSPVKSSGCAPPFSYDVQSTAVDVARWNVDYYYKT